MLSIHRFTGKAEGYAKYRPQYPKEYIDYLIAANNLMPESVVADIGSGTGILARQLLDRGFRVVAVEPNADMRKTAESLLRGYPNYLPVDGTAEATTLPGQSADLVTAAQAFHWFDHDTFKAECRRILKAGGKVALVWNFRVPSSKLTQDIDAVCREYYPNYIGSGGGIEGNRELIESFYQEFEYREFQNDIQYHMDGFIGRILSASDAPRESDSNYNSFINEQMKLFSRYCQNGLVILPQTTCSYLGSV